MTTLSAYIARAGRTTLPAQVAEKTKHHVLDTLGSMVSGSRLLPGKRAISFVRTLGGARESCVAATRILTNATNAALTNGMLAHADETDDSHAASQSHPGCGILPAALAVAEREGSSGTALLRAVALGYDVGCRITMSLDARQFSEDGHSTHSFGPLFGAAAAAASLHRLGAREVRHVLAYAAQQASGLSCWVRDPEHVEVAFDMGGMPARNGVAAAGMVACGFTAVEDVFSGERSFYVAYGRAPRPSELIRELGTSYEIMNTNIKRWTVGSPIQAVLDSLDELVHTHQIAAADVEKLVVRVSHQGAATVNNRPTPNVNMQHMCALMLLDGTVTFESSHDHDRMNNPTLAALRKRVELVGDDALSEALPSREAVVQMTLRSGQTLFHHTRATRGTRDNPMTRSEVAAKSCRLIAPVLGSARARALCDAIWTIETMNDVRKLQPLLQR